MEVILPSEIVLKILRNVDTDTINACRLLCRQWRDIVDTYLYTDEKLWEETCKLKFPRLYKKAKSLARDDTSYFHLYKSLTLWTSLPEANVEVKCLKLHVNEKIRNLQVTEYGIVSVHSKQQIYTYNYLAEESDTENSVKGIFLDFAENIYYFVTLTIGQHLVVNFKEKLQPLPGKHFEVIHEVSSFSVQDREVYVLTTDKNFYCYTFERGIMHREPRFWPDEVHMWSIENVDFLYMSSQNFFQRYLTEEVKDSCSYNPFFFGVQNGFIDNVTLRANEVWLCRGGPFTLVSCVHAYNHHIFVGSQWGVLRVYRVRPTDTDFRDPVKTITLVPKSRNPNVSSILSIQIIEDIHAHKILVATPLQLFLIKITHDDLW